MKSRDERTEREPRFYEKPVGGPLLLLFLVGGVIWFVANVAPNRTPPPRPAPAQQLSPGQRAYQGFHQAYQASADCPQLFDLRNAAKEAVSPAQADDMNIKLQAVGCHTRTSTRNPPDEEGGPSFTVREYRVYRFVLDAPMSEADAIEEVMAEHNLTADEVQATIKKIQSLLVENNWFGRPEAEIQHASDWKGERP